MRPLDEFRARWMATMPISYVDAINRPVMTDSLPPKWGTGLLSSTARADTTLGSKVHVEESGEIIAALFARSGEGGNVLDAEVEALRAAFHGYMTADNTVQFRAVVGPQDIDPMADGEWWRLAFIVPYVVWTVRIEPVAVVAAQDWTG